MTDAQVSARMVRSREQERGHKGESPTYYHERILYNVRVVQWIGEQLKRATDQTRAHP